MSTVEMVMPQMGESIAEATILKWVKAKGEKVEKDEIILEISTDKVDSEIPSPASGVLVDTLFGEGDVVPVKQVIAVIDPAAQAGATASNGATAMEGSVAPSRESEPQQQSFTVVDLAPIFDDNNDQNQATIDARSGDKFFSPVVRSLAQKNGISIDQLETINGTGRNGRVTKQDFMNYLNSGDKNAASTSSTQVAQPAQPAPQTPSTALRTPPPSSGTDWAAQGHKVIPMNGMRQAIAKHMVMSKATSPHVYSVTEVDVSSIAKWRKAQQKEFVEREGFKLSFTPFFLEAAVKGLLEYPEINASMDGNTVVVKKNINLGCAVALGTSGLIVPVIKAAEERNLVGIARGLNDLALRARDKKLLPDEVQGGTFTVTNPGVFGTMIGYPIINQPQLAILSLGAIKKRPVVINDAIAIREMVYLTLSYDHRVIDGSMGGAYLQYVREYLEGWNTSRTLY